MYVFTDKARALAVSVFHRHSKDQIEVPRPWELNINTSMDKLIALSSTVGTRGPQVKNATVEVPRPWELKYKHVHGQTDSAE